jgi:hypothetical protein
LPLATQPKACVHDRAVDPRLTRERQQVRELMVQRWRPAGVALPDSLELDPETVAAISRVTGGNFRVLGRLLTQAERIIEINGLTRVNTTMIGRCEGNDSLECLTRAITGDPRATLGETLKKYPDLVPRPHHEVFFNVGYGSDEARHIKEGREPKREEAELLVGLTAMVATYWSKKCDRG